MNKSDSDPVIEPLTFEEFCQICEEVGIASPDPDKMEADFRVGKVMADVAEELCRATEAFPAMNSAHEGFAVLKEEVDELWECVREKQGGRDIDKMRKEAVQVAAMAIRFAADVCHDEKGQN